MLEPCRGSVPLGNATATKVVHEPVSKMAVAADFEAQALSRTTCREVHENGILIREDGTVAGCPALSLRHHEAEESGFPLRQRRAAEDGDSPPCRDAVAGAEVGERG